MFQSCFRAFQLVPTNSKQLFVRKCNTQQIAGANQSIATPTKKPELNIHNVRISGRVSDVFNNECKGNVTFLVKSIGENFKKTHKAVISTRNLYLFTLAKEYLTKNQYVSIHGKLATEQIKNDDGKIRNSIAIVVGEMLMGEDSEHFKNHMNSVELMGRVTTDVISNPNYRAFTLSVVKKESTATSKPEYTYNRVFVYDKEWFPVVDKIKNRMENILIRGELHYTGCKLPSGQNVASGIIVAHQIYKKY